MGQPRASDLFKAATNGDVETIRKLLAAGSAIDGQDHERMTPVMRAAENGHMAAVRVLVEAGANLHAVGMLDSDVLEAAAEVGGDFVGPVKGPKKLAARLGELCPSCVDEIEGVQELSRGLTRQRAFLLRWN